MSDVETELRRQLTDVLGQADYPVTDPTEFIPLLPDGPATEFRAGDVVVPAIELGTEYGDYQQFPYEAVEPLVDDIVTGLEEEGVL